MFDDPFEWFEADLDEESVPDRTMFVVVPDRPGLPERDLDLRFVVYAGLFDLLVDALVRAATSDDERCDRLAGLRERMVSLLPSLRYRLHERGIASKRDELVARVREREINLTRGWMIPRLREDIRAYRQRIAGLARALEERAS